MYMAILGTLIDEIARPESREEYDNEGKAEFLLTSTQVTQGKGPEYTALKSAAF